jgi:hypothetical protein
MWSELWQRAAWGLLVVASLALIFVGHADSSSGGGRGTIGNPYRLHTMAGIPGSGGWRLRVNSVTRDATKLILDANAINKPPAAGRQFYLWNVTLAYTGKQPSKMIDRVVFYARSPKARVYDFQFDTCGVVPRLIDDLKRLSAGQQISGTLCMSVAKRDAPTLLLLIEPATATPGTTRVYFGSR